MPSAIIPAAQPAVPADRFAREIIAILAVLVTRLRRLNGNPLARAINSLLLLILVLIHLHNHIAHAIIERSMTVSARLSGSIGSVDAYSKSAQQSQRRISPDQRLRHTLSNHAQEK
jgi:hypothetical protein